MDMSLFTTNRRETLVFIAVTILLIGGFGGASIFSILNTNSRNDACRSCRDGTRPNITLGNVVSMPCVNNTIIYNSGNRTNVILNFGIPTGCTGQRGPNATVTLSVFDSANLTYLKDSPRNTTNMSIFITTTETINYIPVVGPQGPPGNAGPQGPPGVQGIQGPQGISSPLILGSGRIITPGTMNLPIPAGATAIYYTMAGSGGGGGGAGGYQTGGCSGGGGGSGYKMTGFEILTGITSITVTVGAGGTGGLSYDTRYYPTAGSNGQSTVLAMNPILTVTAAGGNGGGACSPGQLGGNAGAGGDGGYGGGSGGTSSTGCCIYFAGTSYNEGSYPLATLGFTDGGNGGYGAGPNRGNGGQGNGLFIDQYGRYIGLSGGGGGGGGPLLSSGGNGGSFINSLSGSGHPGAPGSGGGGGGSAGNLAGGDPAGQLNSDLITYGDIGGQGGSGYIDYVFI